MREKETGRQMVKGEEEKAGTQNLCRGRLSGAQSRISVMKGWVSQVQTLFAHTAEWGQGTFRENNRESAQKR